MKPTTILTLSALSATFLALAGSAGAGLVAHWTMDEGTIDDPSAATINSTTSSHELARISAGTVKAGVAGNAVLTPRYEANTTVNDSLRLAGSTTVTVSAWVYQTSSSGSQGIAGYSGRGSTYDIYGFATSSGKLLLNINGGSQATTDNILSLNAWHHVVGVYDSTSGTTLYVDGAPVKTGGTNGVLADKTPAQFAIGSYAPVNEFGFSGLIDDVQVYNTALVLNDVQALYSNPGLDLESIPEPSSLALVGLAGLALLRRRRA